MPLLRLPGVFRPVSDADLLIDAIGREAISGTTDLVDLCTGTGIVAVAAARRGARVTAIDVSRRALACARLNGLLAGVRVETRRGDLFTPLAGRRVDLITVNPPYLPAAAEGSSAPSGAARAWEGGTDGRELITRICAEAADHLRSGGRLLMVHSSIIGVDRTLDAMRAGGLDPSVVARRRGPVGPLVHERAGALRARGYLHPDQHHEDIVVFRGSAPVTPTRGPAAKVSRGPRARGLAEHLREAQHAPWR